MSDPICELDSNGYCVRHQRRHTGAARRLALDSGTMGAHHRIQWDAQLAQRTANARSDATTVAVEMRQSGTKRVVVQNKRKSLDIVRPDRCDHLLNREGFKHGCGGMTCHWGCSQGKPAVPGIYCQSCESYTADEGVPWLS